MMGCDLLLSANPARDGSHGQGAAAEVAGKNGRGSREGPSAEVGLFRVLTGRGEGGRRCTVGTGSDGSWSSRCAVDRALSEVIIIHVSESAEWEGL